VGPRPPADTALSRTDDSTSAAEAHGRRASSVIKSKRAAGKDAARASRQRWWCFRAGGGLPFRSTDPTRGEGPQLPQFSWVPRQYRVTRMQLLPGAPRSVPVK